MTRLATLADVPALVHCAEAFPLQAIEPTAVTPLFEMSITQGACFLAEDNGVVTGFIVGLVLPHPFTGTFYVDIIAFWLLPTHQTSAAALGLLRKLLRFADAEPLPVVKVSAPIGSHLGKVLLKLGFEAVEVTYIKGAPWLSRR